MLLTVLQDVFGRLTSKFSTTITVLPQRAQKKFLAIISAYLIGSALYPEAKTYRLIADILNDAGVILDTLSPLLNTSELIPGLRVGALGLSAACKSLCVISAGGAKAAITIHFATPVNGKGDVGDLNAKDTSKETVLSLLGMLVSKINYWSEFHLTFLIFYGLLGSLGHFSYLV